MGDTCSGPVPGGARGKWTLWTLRKGAGVLWIFLLKKCLESRWETLLCPVPGGGLGGRDTLDTCERGQVSSGSFS